MDSCWASCLGNCSQKLSREHLVSESLFLSEKIRVQGFPWCANNAVDIGISGLTAKILCERHNNTLSPADESGAKAFATFRESMRLDNVRRGMKPRVWNVKQFRIDGPGLERWCLKTLINLSCNGTLPIGRDSQVAGRPSERLVRVAYGLESFQGRAGLYFVVRPGMVLTSDETVRFSPLIKNNSIIEGGLFTFRGMNLLLFLEPEGPPEPLDGVFINGEDLGYAQLNFHNREIKTSVGKYLSQVIRIDW
jgi:hypothetical protein